MTTSNEGQTPVVDWVKKRWYGTTILMCVFCLMIGTGLAMVIGRTAPNEFWLIYGGNTDPGDGQGGGLARQQLIDGGWTTPENSFQIQWAADIANGTIQESDAAMAQGKDAIARYCGGRRCIIAGFSLGTSPALQLSAETGGNPSDNYIFGGPAPATGIWHNAWIDNQWVEPAVRTFGRLAPDRFVPAGTQVFFDVRDPYANAAPQCSQPWALSLDGHRIIRRDEADQHVWTGPDGAVNHEAGYAGPDVLPLSGADPSPIWAGCFLNDWHKTPNSPGDTPTDTGGGPGGVGSGGTDQSGPPPDDSQGGAPALPGAPQLPGVPGTGG